MRKKKHTKNSHTSRKWTVFTLAGFFVFLCVVLVVLIKSKEFIFESTRITSPTTADVVKAFPLGVDPAKKLIVENPEVDEFAETHLSQGMRRSPSEGWFNRTLAFLLQMDWYQNLASPISRILVIDSGERKEEIASHFKDILNWSDDEASIFVDLVANSTPILQDGKFSPGHYVVNHEATPHEVAALIHDQFRAQILSRYPEEVAEIVPLSDALSLASLLEREAYDFNDMRYISGIIWNRLFLDMNLQLDASLQYAKAGQGSKSWWPQVIPEDKFIDSPFNTYQHSGLPPSPIANPSSSAILAALNPKDTNCLFYFHDASGGFHCTQTYEEHVALLKEIYGQGR